MVYGAIGKSKRFIQSTKSIYLWCKPFDQAFVNKVRTLPVKYYWSETKQWEVPFSLLNAVETAFPGTDISGLEKPIELPQGFKNLEEYEAYLASLTLQADYTPKTKMDPHQVEWFNMMLTRDRILNADPMGLGKTKEYLDVCEYRRQALGYRKILFVCGAKYKWNMAKQIAYHTNSTCMVVDGTKTKRIQQLRDFFYSDDYYLVMGYESLQIHVEQITLLACNMGFDGLLVDESQKLRHYVPRKKGQKKHITVQLVDLFEEINPELLILGTGTPVSKKAEETYTALRLAGDEDRNFWQFRDRYCTFDHFGRITGYKNLQELHDKLNAIMIRRPKELLHLKEPRPEFIPLRMEADQLRFYHACVLQLRSELKGTKALGVTDLTKILRLRQITCNPSILDAEGISSIKEDVVVEMVQEAAERGEKSIIFTLYLAEVDNLCERLEKLQPAKVVGSMSSKKAQAEVDRLQEDPECMCLVGSLMACKESYDMWAATNVFLLDCSYNWTDNDQAIARAWRRGQENTVNIYYLYCEGTVDEAVFGILSNDRKLADQLVGVEGKSVRTFDVELLDQLLISPKDPRSDDQISIDFDKIGGNGNV